MQRTKLRHEIVKSIARRFHGGGYLRVHYASQFWTSCASTATKTPYRRSGNTTIFDAVVVAGSIAFPVNFKRTARLIGFNTADQK
jgi:hypothetical protein